MGFVPELCFYRTFIFMFYTFRHIGPKANGKDGTEKGEYLLRGT
jgi:hypothetical protein